MAEVVVDQTTTSPEEWTSMELIGIELSDFTRRSRSLLLHHCDLALDRILRPGEKVILWDAVSEDYHSGTVADVDHDGDHVHYRFEVGIRLPEQLALDRLTGFPTAATSESTVPALGTHEVLELLHQLRGDAPGMADPLDTALHR